MGTSQATLLIVADEKLNRDGLARRLQRNNYEVVAARCGSGAVEGWRGEVPRQEGISALLVERREATS
jgi:hypothetical protein